MMNEPNIFCDDCGRVLDDKIMVKTLGMPPVYFCSNCYYGEKTMTLKQLINEWLSTLDNEKDYWDGVFCSDRDMAKGRFNAFIKWCLETYKIELENLKIEVDNDT